jgi:hypothetical protein
MEKKDKVVEYAKPQVADFGSLQELTAAGGTLFADTPVGTPIGDVTASSTP